MLKDWVVTGPVLMFFCWLDGENHFISMAWILWVSDTP